MSSSESIDIPLVSVIIPNHNYGHFINQSIESVLHQTYPRIELIVVDDGSTDDSVKIVEKYRQSLTLIEQTNCGVSAARNHGMHLANGDFICFLDSDDSWESDKIELQMAKFDNEDVGAIYSSINICDENLVYREIMPAIHKGECSHLYFKFPTKAIILLGCSSAIIRKNIVSKVGEFDTSLNTSADWDYFRRVANITRVDFVEKPLVNYRRHSASMSAGSLEKYYRDNELAIIKLIEEAIGKSLTTNLIGNPRLTWIIFQLGAVKALLRGLSFTEAFRHFRKMFHNQPSTLRKASQKA